MDKYYDARWDIPTMNKYYDGISLQWINIMMGYPYNK